MTKLNTTHIQRSRLSAAALTFALAVQQAIAAPAPAPLKDAFPFKLGVAVYGAQLGSDKPDEAALIRRHFNSITAENEMKPDALQPNEGEFRFDVADAFVDFGERSGMKIIGHCLVWHNQMPPWFFKNSDGTETDRETLIARMRKHIHTVVGRYKGRVHGWDVVNEAFDGAGNLHDSPWLRIIGSDFIDLAFRFAHEADPSAELYYNDFGMSEPGKRRGVVRMLRDFRAKGIRIDGVGMQSHVNLTYPSLDEYEASLTAFAAEGVKVMATELDVSVLPSAWSLTAEITASHDYNEKYNPWPGGTLPAEIQSRLTKRYEDLFRIFLRHSNEVDRVTLWGLEDGHSWLNDFPVKGRTDYPLFFDRDLAVKPCAYAAAALQSPKRTKIGKTTAVPQADPIPHPPAAKFRRFEMKSELTLPKACIIPGMAPDPSITRKGSHYYLANSSFSYYPGIPIWHSTDLITWDFCGYCATRPSQLMLKDGVDLSAGVFAPDIKYNPYNDTFYLIVTIIGAGGNVIFKTKDPRLGWSEPIKTPIGGIDPSMFFESADTAWILNNDDAPDGKPEYPGHRTVRMRKYDLRKDEVVPGTDRIIINKGVHPEDKPIWCEGPHLYKIDGTYYVMTAEGGTGGWHSEVIWHSDSITGPYKPCPVNPILTQRDIRDAAVTCAGHADLIETPMGDWRAVFLGVVPYRARGRDWCPTGRSTFLLPVKWVGKGDERQPVILDKGKRIELDAPPRTLIERDDFTKPAVSHDWFQIRTPQEAWFRSAPGGSKGLEIAARPVSIHDKGNPSCLCRWLKSSVFTVSVVVSFKATRQEELAGLVLYQNETCNYVLGKTTDADGNPIVVLEKSDKDSRRRIASAPLGKDGPVMLRAEAKNEIVRFSFSRDGKKWTGLGGDEDATILTTDYAGGFTGAVVGLYATTTN